MSTTNTIQKNRKRSLPQTIARLPASKKAKTDDNATQQQYEEAIKKNQFKKFLALYKSKQVASGSAAALRLASQSKNDKFLQTIVGDMDVSDWKRFIRDTSLQTSSAAQSDVDNATKSEKRKLDDKIAPSGGSNGNCETPLLANNLDAIEKLIARWPFQTARVAWTDEYQNPRSSQPPFSRKQSQAKWQQLLDISKEFFGLPGGETESATAPKESLFRRLEQMARVEKSGDESLDVKLRNCRQTTRMVFSRLLFIEDMKITLRSSGGGGAAAAPDEVGKKVTFRALLRKYAVPIPPASFFKGNKVNFANAFKHHLNAKIFFKLDCLIDDIEYAS